MAKQAKQKKHDLVSSLHNASNVAYLAPLDDNKWLLEFVAGKLKSNEAWFLKTEDNKEFVVLPQNALNNLLGHLRISHEEKLKILLRYEIKDLMPIDIEDTMVVAIHELEKHRQEDGNLPMINIKNLAQEIKINYPNLFLQLDNLFH
ncbi:DUF2603 domain-containing protein [Helicobacter muridarum]|uniref:Protein of uncharacterized function (DUF2603) n=5 Tax=Helicobacter muridarum TaxID=216 RepID=A0A099TWT6_9HELI|nr:DUF2603 domain-containing protein [Helicobacter muridarum]STQ86159.1 Protein of uncharacterised function (DUF2603) [Helicobacter muridarum]